MTLGSGYLYLPDGWDTGWKTARETSPNPRVLMLGDSISLGVGTTNQTCFTEQLYRYLAGQLGVQSDHFAAQMGYINGDGGLPWSNQQNNATVARYTTADGWMGFVYSNAIQLTTPAAAPTAAGSGTGGTLAAATYYYAATFRNAAAQETGIGPASTGYAATGTTSSVALSAIPTGPAGTTSRRIYRSTDGVTWGLVNTIGDNTTTTWTDTGSIAGAAPPASNGTSVASQTFTTPYPCTALDIIYYDAFAAASTTWGYQVDGGTVQTVTNAASGTLKKISVSGLAYGIHTVGYGWQSVNAAVAMQGITTYRSPAGSGMSFARMHAAGAQMFDCLPAFWLQSAWAGFPTNPHLAIIALVTNDIANGVSVANFTKALNQMIHVLRRNTPGCSILIIAPDYPDSVTDDVNPASFANGQIAYTYHVEMLRLAQAYDCAFLNMNAKWGSTPFASGFLPVSDLHPTQAGQNDYFATIAPLL